MLHLIFDIFSFEKIRLAGKNNQIITRGRKIVEQVQPSQNKSWRKNIKNRVELPRQRTVSEKIKFKL